VDSQKFAALDAIRGIAAILVMIRHTPDFWGSLDVKSNHSYLAVDIFFILSGFVISHAYGEKLSQGRLSARRFLLIRWIRLYPLYALAAIVSFVVATVRVSSGVANETSLLDLFLALLLTLLFLPSKLPPNQGLFPLNFPFWSLFYEVLWNIVYALVRRWLSTPLLAGTLCISALGLSAISVYNGSIDMGFSWGYRSFVGGSLRSFFGIFLGIFLHRLYERRILHRFVVGGVGVPLMVTTAVLVFPTLGGSADLAFELLAVALVFPACVYAGACASINSRASRVFAVLGFLSYPLYCLHAPASQIVRNFLDPSTTPHSVLVGSSFAVLLAIVCLAVDRFYERPVRKLLTGLAARMMAGHARQPG
jgi:peptidoglycan/LPS O-acetylase OafA/YrhL